MSRAQAPKIPSAFWFVVQALACMGLPVLLIWAYQTGRFIDLPDTLTERGQFGDQFGAPNALFSGLAVGGLLLSLYLNFRQFRAYYKENESRAQEHANIVTLEALSSEIHATGALLESLNTSLRIQESKLNKAEHTQTIRLEYIQSLQKKIETNEKSLYSLSCEARKIREIMAQPKS